jgi:replicative DNA helicase
LKLAILTSRTIFKICSKFERFAGNKKGKVPVLVIDNLGLIKPHLKNEVQNDDDIARMLKDLRDKTGALIIVLHHLSKESEGKFNITEQYAPKVTHIRGSSRLVDFANKVMLLHRPEMYRDVVKHFEKEGKGHLIHGRMEVNIALNRNGDIGIIDLRHDLAYCNFDDWK